MDEACQPDRRANTDRAAPSCLPSTEPITQQRAFTDKNNTRRVEELMIALARAVERQLKKEIRYDNMSKKNTTKSERLDNRTLVTDSLP